VRIVIGEDSALFREALAALLTQAGHTVVATASDAPALLDVVRSHRPDLAVVDIRMPPDLQDDGARAALELRDEFPDLGLLLLSQHLELEHSVALAGSPAFGYLLKDRVLEVDDFLQTLERIAAGGSALDPMVVARLVRSHTEVDRLAVLSTREREILGLISEGLTNAGIAKRLWLSERTIEGHVTTIMNKLGIHGADGHRRVLAVLAFLGGGTDPAGDG
jgi:DNA-binding NarL/FixJ family response regulator